MLIEKERVLVIGHTGFKGAWLGLALSALKVETFGISIDYTKNGLFDVCQTSCAVKSLYLDIRNFNDFYNALVDIKPTVVIHFAAQSLVSKSFVNPKSTFETNIMGTFNLLEIIRTCKSLSVKALLIATSDKCYDPNASSPPYDESAPLGGVDPYSASKACAEIVVSSFLRSKLISIPCATVRAGNVIGGGDWSENRLIPDCVRAYFENRELIIKNPHHIRPWQFVMDPLIGYLKLVNMLLEHGHAYSGGWNFGADRNSCWTVSKIIEHISSQLKGKLKYSILKDVEIPETEKLILDVTKARDRLAWHQKSSIEESLDKTLAWYECFYQGSNIIDLTNLQVLEYLDFYHGKSR